MIAVLVTVAMLSGCGAEKSISQADAQDLFTRLDTIENAIADGNCEQAAGKTDNLRVAAEGVSDTASSDLQTALERSISRLQDLIASECTESVTDATGPTGEETTGPTAEPPTGTTEPAGTEVPAEQPVPDNEPNPGGGNQTPPAQPPANDSPDSGGVSPDSGGGQ